MAPYPQRLIHRMTDPLWFSQSKKMTESSLDQLERDEEDYEAKMKGISEIQAMLPIGVTPAIMSLYEKKVQEIRDSGDDDRPVVTTLFWNRKAGDSAKEEVAKTRMDVHSLPQQHVQPMTPLSSGRAESEFSFGLNTPQSMVQSINLNTPQSHNEMDSSYNLDTSNDASLDLGNSTPQSRMSP